MAWSPAAAVHTLDHVEVDLCRRAYPDFPNLSIPNLISILGDGARGTRPDAMLPERLH